MTQELLTVQEVAERLKINQNSVYALIASGKLPAYRVSPKLWRIRADELGTYLKEAKGGKACQ